MMVGGLKKSTKDSYRALNFTAKIGNL
jgi:hypothetical protein